MHRHWNNHIIGAHAHTVTVFMFVIVVSQMHQWNNGVSALIFQFDSDSQMHDSVWFQFKVAFSGDLKGFTLKAYFNQNENPHVLPNT